MKCKNCGESIKQDDSYWAELGTKKGKPYGGDVCSDCYYEIVETCQLCDQDNLMPSEVSPYILVKAELGRTAARPPGIYRITRHPFLNIPMLGGGSMQSSSVVFIDHLPKPDANYDISGHICHRCARPYRQTDRRVYGRMDMSHDWKKKSWVRQREHVRSVILAYPDMLRDLECDPDPDRGDWADMQRIFCLPDRPPLPTYHEWVLLKFRGVTVYRTCQDYGQQGEGWLVLRPEPKWRSGRATDWDKGYVTFCASSLPTYPQYDHAAAEKAGVKYHPSCDEWARKHALKAIRSAIARRLIRKDGTYDAQGHPHCYG